MSNYPYWPLEWGPVQWVLLVIVTVVVLTPTVAAIVYRIRKGKWWTLELDEPNYRGHLD